MTHHDESTLRVHEMRVLWRDTFILDEPPAGRDKRPADFLEWSKTRLRKLPIYLGDRFTRRHDQPDPLRVIERASRNVARIGYDSILRYQFKPFRMVGLQPMLSRMHTTPDTLNAAEIELTAQEADAKYTWIDVTPMLVLHRAGVGIMEYLATMAADGKGFTPDEAIERVRLGISTQLLDFDNNWREVIPENKEEWGIFASVPYGENRHLTIGGLRDMSQIVGSFLAQSPKAKPKGKVMPIEASPSRPTGSTTVVLVKTEPEAGRDFGAFLTEHAPALRGIGAMDTYYKERAKAVVEREFSEDLSTDSESAVFLLGNSELVLFNDELDWVVNSARERMSLPNNDLVITYLYMHYEVLMEWTYMQDAILRAYITRLDAHVAQRAPRRRQMIATLQGALSDLIQYQENITPFATRIEFLEKARAQHKLDELGDRFERKQEMLLNYASEFHDYRDARATEFLNFLVGILSGASIAELIVTLTNIQPTQTGLYLGIYIGCMVVVLAILWIVQRLV